MNSDSDLPPPPLSDQCLPTVGSTRYHGEVCHSIYKPIQEETASNESVGLDVDFNVNFSREYEYLDYVQDKDYRMAKKAVSQHSPKKQSDLKTSISSVERKKKREYCIKTIIIYSLCVVSFLSLLLEGFIFFNSYRDGKITGQFFVEQSTSNQFRQVLDEVHDILNILNDSHSMNLQSISTRLSNLTISVKAEENHSPPPSLSITLYDNCTTTLQSDCTVMMGANPPLYNSCTTTPISPEDVRGTYVSNVFCAVNVDQLMPVASSMSLSRNKWSCVCYGLEIPVELQSNLRSFRCELHVTRCPMNIGIPRHRP